MNDESAMALHILLVEDHPVLQEVMLEFVGKLPQVGRCTAVSDAEAALDGLDGELPDLMLIDLSLPGMDGIELIRELRKRHPELPCAILSGHRS